MQSKKIFKNRISIIVVCLLVAYPVANLPGKLTHTVTKSVKPRWFWTTDYNDDSPIEQDMYIRANVYKDLPGMNCNPCLIVKRVGCAPGSELKTVDNSFYCDGKIIGEAHREDYLKFSQKLAENEVFLIGDIDISYDSRYFGVVEKERINAILTPLF